MLLHKAENVTIRHYPGAFFSNGNVVLTIGRSAYILGKVNARNFREQFQAQLVRPLLLVQIKGRHYWQFQNKFYWETEGLRANEVHSIIVTREQRMRQYIDRAQATAAMAGTPRHAAVRQVIPDDLKLYIWTRDEGRCRACGATTDLQYDHIIPLKMGGSNNAENLQVLCGSCNRSKSAGLTVRKKY